MKNIGPKSRQWLAEIGIYTIKDLRNVGSITTYKILKERYPKKVSLNLLWRLEAAIHDIDWRELTEADKQELKKKLREKRVPITPSTLTLDKILTLLAETPQRIAAFTKGLTAVQLRTKPNPEEWSANEVLAHLRSCADVWGNCIEVILAQDEPTIRAINPRTWIERTDYLEQDFPSALRAFTKQRKKLLAILEPLAPEDWLRKATVTGAGKPLVRTVLSYVEWMATHERPHVKQIGRIASTMRK